MRKEAVNPKMDLKREKSTPAAEALEHESPKTQEQGNVPSGMKAAKKSTIGMG